MRWSTCVIALLALVSLASAETKSPPAGKIERDVLTAVNAERKKAGLKPLTADAGLAKIARGHSCAMAQRDFFDHETPEGEKLSDRMRKAGRTYRSVGENIGRIENMDPVKTVVSGWMESAPHRANILTKEFTRAGVGACRGDAAATGRHVTAPVYFTQIFLTPR